MHTSSQKQPPPIRRAAGADGVWVTVHHLTGTPPASLLCVPSSGFDSCMQCRRRQLPVLSSGYPMNRPRVTPLSCLVHGIWLPTTACGRLAWHDNSWCGSFGHTPPPRARQTPVKVAGSSRTASGSRSWCRHLQTLSHVSLLHLPWLCCSCISGTRLMLHMAADDRGSIFVSLVRTFLWHLLWYVCTGWMPCQHALAWSPTYTAGNVFAPGCSTGMP